MSIQPCRLHAAIVCIDGLAVNLLLLLLFVVLVVFVLLLVVLLVRIDKRLPTTG